MLINALRVRPRMVLRAVLDAQVLGKHDSEALWRRVSQLCID